MENTIEAKGGNDGAHKDRGDYRASTGIGRATAEHLVASGYRAFGSVRKQDTGGTIQRILGPKFVPLVFDVADTRAILKARDEVAESFGHGLNALLGHSPEYQTFAQPLA